MTSRPNAAVLIPNVSEEVVAQRHRAGILGSGVRLLIVSSRQRGRPVASVRGVRDVTERPYSPTVGALNAERPKRTFAKVLKK